MSGFIPDEIIDQIRLQTDIAEVIGQFVELRHRGRNWLGLCPFHSERTPSFTVTPDKGFFKCFGCGKAGDVYSFLMEHQKLDFAQAVGFLAERLGITIPRGQFDQKEDEHRGRLIYANQFARDYFRGCLAEPAEGRAARDYLAQRGLSPEVVERNELGWAPREREALKKAALGHGIEEATLREAGLLTTPDEQGQSVDRFRGRVMFPIHDLGGRTIAFGGRILGPGEPKYLNSPETPLFRKGEILFGLDRARGPIRQEGWAVVVEGYMDRIALATYGYETAVAPLGTALTPEQAALLSRYAREVFLLYDPDTAGLKATFRGGDELLAAGLAVRVISLPGAEDPDEFLRAHGAAEFETLRRAAVDFLDRKIDILRQKMDLRQVAQREQAADKLLESVARCKDSMARTLYLRKCVEFIEVPEAVLQERLSRIESRARRVPQRTTAPVGEQAAAAAETPTGGVSGALDAERYVLAICILHPDYIPQTLEALGDPPFESSLYAQAFDTLSELQRSGVRNLIEALYQGLPSALYPLLAELAADATRYEPAPQVFGYCWRRIKVGRILKHLEESMQKLAVADDPELIREQALLHKEMKKLEREMSSHFAIQK
ncbi:DNA primase [bacterium]|nr:DNA primase [bacterium]